MGVISEQASEKSAIHKSRLKSGKDQNAEIGRKQEATRSINFLHEYWLIGPDEPCIVCHEALDFVDGKGLIKGKQSVI